jgi:hypothetical protein
MMTAQRKRKVKNERKFYYFEAADDAVWGSSGSEVLIVPVWLATISA